MAFSRFNCWLLRMTDYDRLLIKTSPCSSWVGAGHMLFTKIGVTDYSAGVAAISESKRSVTATRLAPDAAKL
jgi:hypothetical protein